MSEISRPMLAAYAAAAVAIVVLGVRWLGQGGGEAPRSAPAGASASRPRGGAVRLSGGGGGPVVVHVAGAVRRPGVYRLRGGSRAIDALRRAGGATPAGNPHGIDLAAKLADGVQVVIPPRAPSGGGATAGAGAAEPAGGASGVGGAAPAASGPLSLNSATAEQLDGLDGVGPETARKIIAYRTEHGGFGSVDELDRVPGIGAKKLAGLRGQVVP